MNECLILLGGIGFGYVMGLASILLGSYMAATSRSGGTPFVKEPEGGGAFTIPFNDDAPKFPVEEDTIAKDKLLGKTNEFLKIFGGK